MEEVRRTEKMVRKGKVERGETQVHIAAKTSICLRTNTFK